MQMNGIINENLESVFILKMNYSRSLPFRSTPLTDQKTPTSHDFMIENQWLLY